MYSILTIIVFILIILSPAIILIPFIFWLGNHQNKKVWKHTALLADELKITLYGRNENHKMYDFPYLTGVYNNRKIELYVKEIGSGKSRSRTTFLTVSVNKNINATFSLQKRNFLNKIVLFFTNSSININYKGFDSKFVLYGTNEEYIKQLFNQDVCKLLMETDFAFHSNINFKDSLIVYTETSLILSENIKNRFKSMLTICCSISEKIENLR